MTAILIVEDQERAGSGLAKLFIKYGAKPVHEKTGEAAIARLGLSPFDAVVLDLGLKNSDIEGLGVLNWIKKERPQLPVVIVTADDALGAKALEVGVDGLLRKPVEGSHVLGYVERAIELRRLRRENARLKHVLRITTSATVAAVVPLLVASLFAILWARLYPGSPFGWFAGFVLAVLSVIGARRIQKFTLEFFRLKLKLSLSSEDAGKEAELTKSNEK